MRKSDEQGVVALSSWAFLFFNTYNYVWNNKLI